MSHFPTRGPLAILAALAAPLAVCAVLLPFRSNIADTNVALILVVVVVAAAALGHRLAGALAAVSAAVWFDFFFTLTSTSRSPGPPTSPPPSCSSWSDWRSPSWPPAPAASR
ncbi:MULTISPECIES: DUF4118 domain-containing protein [unclassified Streptomyces]|uniref:DUF4118 domain-containing protein n=1 Tax=unclassified Streptomyces TaxID=2593676 RepID=UPI002B1D28F1|nr:MULTISPECIES: DUF4118 domain-containing protein [unclassified Streptomyces]